ncbi:Uncharacterized protein APZ42_027993 [Daphnia magna]|uniref:Uncharacterized protein n=1 Tax=Daphnia magna TaxID=35525 RepID=A0A0P6FWB1_9CRUS|nr:Uncharacterized protein APZ42_027993 [Daphnia magna]
MLFVCIITGTSIACLCLYCIYKYTYTQSAGRRSASDEDQHIPPFLIQDL